MAADSRVTEGYTLEGPVTRDDSVKFLQLGGYCGAMTHGIYDIGTNGISALEGKIEGDGNDNTSVLNIVEAGRQIFSGVNDAWTGEHPDVARRDKDVGFIVGGLDRSDMSLKVYSLESPAFVPVLIKGNFFLAGQWHIARFLLSKCIATQPSLQGLVKMAAVALTATAGVDKTVGGPVRIATITKSEGFKWVNDGEMSTISEFDRSFCHFFPKLLISSLAAALETWSEDNVKA